MSDLFNRLFERTAILENDCWEFLGERVGGYGRISVAGKKVLAHRLAYDLCVDDIPAGMYVLHSCDNPACINPKHLFLGTQQDNMDDMKSKGRQGDRKGSSNSKAFLCEAEVAEIKQELLINKKTCQDLADQYKVSRATIYSIKHGKIWNHV